MATPNPLQSNPQTSPAKPDIAKPILEEIIAQQAVNLKDVTGAAQLYIAVMSSIAPDISTEALKIYRQKLPWQYTRGPITPEGKAKVAQNGRYA